VGVPPAETAVGRAACGNEKEKKTSFTCGGRAACGNEKERKQVSPAVGLPLAVKK
jgi:hypothetical protein